MLKQRFVFAVSLFAILAVGNVWADTASGDAVKTAHDVYTDLSTTETGIAGVSYVNKMVNAAGAAAQDAENHAASAGASALSAAVAAAEAKDSAAAAETVVAGALAKAESAVSTANAAKGTAEEALQAATDATDSAAASAAAAAESASAAAASATSAETAWNKFSNNAGTVGTDAKPVYMNAGKLTQVTSIDSSLLPIAKDKDTVATNGGDSMVPSVTRTQSMISNSITENIINGYVGTLNSLKTENKETIVDAINEVDAEAAAKLAAVSSTGSGVVKTVAKDGTTVKVTAGTVATAEIADGAVTVAKTTGLYGVIPSGSQGNTAATAFIWVE